MGYIRCYINQLLLYKYQPKLCDLKQQAFICSQFYSSIVWVRFSRADLQTWAELTMSWLRLIYVSVIQLQVGLGWLTVGALVLHMTFYPPADQSGLLDFVFSWFKEQPKRRQTSTAIISSDSFVSYLLLFHLLKGVSIGGIIKIHGQRKVQINWEPLQQLPSPDVNTNF